MTMPRRLQKPSPIKKCAETPAALLDRLSTTAREGHDTEWVHFISDALKLPPCYLPAAQNVLDQERWRKFTGRGHNPIGYVKTATMREAMRMGLGVDLRRPSEMEPRVETGDRKCVGRGEERIRLGLAPLKLPKDITQREYSEYFDGADIPDVDDEAVNIPPWLQLSDEPDRVDWDKVAKYAVLKPQMAPRIAKVLRLRAEGWSLARLLEIEEDDAEKHKTEAAWKWIDQKRHARIAPLFLLDKPPANILSAGPRKARKAPRITAADALRRAIDRERLLRNQFVNAYAGPSNPLNRPSTKAGSGGLTEWCPAPEADALSDLLSDIKAALAPADRAEVTVEYPNEDEFSVLIYGRCFLTARDAAEVRSRFDVAAARLLASKGAAVVAAIHQQLQ
jgi:hypothetical protein